MATASSFRPTPQDVIATYQVMLGRQPESPSAIQGHLESRDVVELVRNVAGSPEFQTRIGGSTSPSSPFLHVNSPLDVADIVYRNVDAGRTPKAGCYVNFLGVAVPTFVFGFLADKGGQLDQVPVPANYHADMAEWAAAIRSVDLAKRTYSMIELGCGWGCWMVNTGVLAKRRGLEIDLQGVEGDPIHVDYAHKVMRTNGILPNEYRVTRGIAAARSGAALFPSRKADEEGWGLAPVFDVGTEESETAVASGNFDRLDMISLEALIGKRDLVDLVHIDIQGGEGDLVEGTAALLTERVGYVLIGTHSRILEGRLMEILFGRGWALEIERPAIFGLADGVPQMAVDGVQGWRNPKFHG